MKKPVVRIIAPKISEEEKRIAWDKVQKVAWEIINKKVKT